MLRIKNKSEKKNMNVQTISVKYLYIQKLMDYYSNDSHLQETCTHQDQAQ